MITTTILLKLCFGICFLGSSVHADGNFILYDPPLRCNEERRPAYCGFPNVTLDNLMNVEDFEECGPGTMEIGVRNYFYGTAGRAITYKRNLDGYKKYALRPRMLRNLDDLCLQTQILGNDVDFPFGISVIALQKLANNDGELASVRAAVKFGVPYILSLEGSTSIEDVAAAARSVDRTGKSPAMLMMQLYPLENRDFTLQVVRRAERENFKAIVLTVDHSILPSRNCDTNNYLLDYSSYPNVPDGTSPQKLIDAGATFEYIRWLSRQTELPLVAKGILDGDDAKEAIRSGARGILVSNHGARQLDSVPGTVEALPEIVEALKEFPDAEVYLDGGVRNGFSIFKGLALGAKAVLVGRPVAWGLSIAGQDGVEKVLEILQNEFNETMILSGHSNVRSMDQTDVLYLPDEPV